MAQQLSRTNSPKPPSLQQSPSPRYLTTTPGRDLKNLEGNDITPKIQANSESEDEQPDELLISADRCLQVDGIEDSLDEFSAKQTAKRFQNQKSKVRSSQKLKGQDVNQSQMSAEKRKSLKPGDSVHFKLETYKTNQSLDQEEGENFLFLGAPKPQPSKNVTPAKERPVQESQPQQTALVVLDDNSDPQEANTFVQTTTNCETTTPDLVPKEKTFSFFAYNGNYPERIKESLQRRGNWIEHKDEATCVEKCHFIWRPVNYGSDGYKRIDRRVVRNTGTPLIYNHFEVLKGLTTKTGLIKSMKHYYCQNDQARFSGYQVFDSTPSTFLVPQSLDDSEASDFIQRYKDLSKGYCPKERTPMKHCANNIWLVKPAAANQGRGIEIFNELSDILKFISTRQKYTCWVVQKYIERPLLFKDRKFDIRVWVLVNQRQEIYMYTEGYLRTSSDDYELSNGNNYVHLTNNCLQQNGTNYGKHEDGNTVSYDVFQNYLDEKYPEQQINVREHFVPRMKDLVIDTILSVKTQLNPCKRKNVFELFGYDFLIDEDMRLWLIEVNTNPYLGIPNTFIEKLLPKMVDDMIQLAVDPVYQPKIVPESNKLPNGFELIYSDCNISSKVSTFLGYVNQRRPFGTPLYPSKYQDQGVKQKTIKTDMKIVEQYRQNITICSIPAYHQNRAVIQAPVIIAPDSTQQQQMPINNDRPQTAKLGSLSVANSPAKFYHPLGNKRLQLNTRDGNTSTKRQGIPQLIPEENSRSLIQNRKRLQSASSFSNFQSVEIRNPNNQLQLAKALQVQPPKTQEIIKDTLEQPSVQSRQQKAQPLSVAQLRDKFKGLLTINNGRPLVVISDSSLLQQHYQQQNKIAYYLDFDTLFKRLLQIIKHMLVKKLNSGEDIPPLQPIQQTELTTDEGMVIEILNIIAKSDQLVFLERENCLLDILKSIHLIIDSSEPSANKEQMLIAVKLSELFGRLSRKTDVQNLIMMQESLLLELTATLFLNKGIPQYSESAEYKITLQNLGLSLIHSSHLYALDQSANGTRILLQSPKVRINEQSIDEMILQAAGLSSMSLATSQGQRKVYIPGNTRQTQIFNNRAFDCGIVSGFQQSLLDDKNPLNEIVKLNLLSFFRKPLNIQRQIRILRGIQERIQINNEVKEIPQPQSQSRMRSVSRIKAQSIISDGNNLQTKSSIKPSTKDRGIAVGVLLKHNPLDNNFIIKNLFDQKFLDLDKLIEFNLTLLYDKSDKNTIQENSLQGFMRDQSLHGAVRRSLKQTPGSTGKKVRTSRDSQLLRQNQRHNHHQSQEIRIVDDDQLSDGISEKSQNQQNQEQSNTELGTQPRKELMQKFKDPQQLFFSPVNSSILLAQQTKRQTRILAEEKLNQQYQQDKMKSINEFFAANLEGKTNDNFATFMSGQGEVEKNNEMQTINSSNENYCRQCFTSPLQRRANLQIKSDHVLSSAQFNSCKNCGHNIELERNLKTAPNSVPQKDRLKELQDQYQRLLSQADFPNSQYKNGRRVLQNSFKNQGSQFDHPNRRNLLTGQNLMSKKVERVIGINQIIPVQEVQAQSSNTPLSPTRKLLVTTVEMAQQQFANSHQIARSPINQTMDGVNQSHKSLLSSGGLQAIQSVTQSPIKPRGSSQENRKKVNTSRTGKLKASHQTTHQQQVNQVHLMNMMSNYGVQDFKMHKGSLASQILAVSRPQTQQTQQKLRRESDIRKRQRQEDIKALYQQQLIVMNPNGQQQSSTTKINSNAIIKHSKY